MEVELSILICTIGKRHDKFARLLSQLMPQVEKYKGRIEVVAYWNNGELPLAEIRQALMDDAKGKYMAFVDDDDELPEYYCEDIMNALKQDPDYVGWRMQAYHNDEPLKPTFHSIKYDKWDEDEEGFYRNASHLNPIKTSIARQVPFAHTSGVPEDYNWAKQVAPLLKTEVFIGRPMYYYKHRTEDSSWRGDFDKTTKYERPDVTFKYFRYFL